MAGRHGKIIVDLPAWLQSSKDTCLVSVAEDAYTAKAFAKNAGADTNPSCAGLMQAAGKSLKVMEDGKRDSRQRCKEGDRAARKFWEAKVCARS